MNWKLHISRQAEKFVAKNELMIEEVQELIAKAVRYFRGEDINIDIKKLHGKWSGFYRIRSGHMRIIAEFDFQNSAVFIEEIDWRGNIY